MAAGERLGAVILGEIRSGILLLARGKRRARAHGLILVTRNRADFSKAGVRLLNPFDE